MKNNFLFIIFSIFLISCNSTINETSTSIKKNKEVIIISKTTSSGTKIQDHYFITVHYIGKFENGEIFDSSYKRKKPFQFQYGLRQVIEGWNIGLKDIRVGEKRNIQIPANLAYGNKGISGVIPPNSSLIFEIEVLNIEPHNYFIITDDILYNIKKENFLNLKYNKIILVDIRDEKEILETGTIKDAYNIRAFDKIGNINSNFLPKIKKIAKENDHIILFDNEGDISKILANGLVENIGMKNVYSLKEGIRRWIKNDYPIVR